jgi:Kef-type K+ transport system membrane component KefB
MSELLRFLTQLMVILASAGMARAVLARWAQPPVIGEILAGILLGPSLFGRIAPDAFAALFPTSSLAVLNIVSQIGLIVFMFLVGLRLDAEHLRTHGAQAIWISAVSIAAPLLAGAGLALTMYPRLAPPGVPVLPFALFLGVAMSITAFLVLARILDDTRLLHTALGVMVISCAAIDDLSAWVLLAAVIATAAPDAHGQTAAVTLGLVCIYTVVVWALRPVLALLSSGPRPLSTGRLTAVVVIAIMSAAATEWVGIHAVFGAFFIGLVIPKDDAFVQDVTAALQPLTGVVLLPMFFAYTGLRMTVPSVSTELLVDLFTITLVAVVAKGGGAMVAARMAGQPWRESACIGVLMNTRGLVELVVLNIGLDAGILSPALFSLMVVMALLTTTATAPTIRALRVTV